MVPWARRVRDGVLRWSGEEHRLPTHLVPPHAIHGTLLETPWEVVEVGPDRATMAVDLGPPWPFRGRAVHRISLTPGSLYAELEIHAGDRPMPAIVGWHPWFPRVLRDAAGAAVGQPVVVDLAAAPGVHWPGALEVQFESDAPCGVVYTEHETGVCVEPQTGPPNGLNTGEHALVEAGAPPVAAMTVR